MSADPPIRLGLSGCGAVSQLYYKPALQELERIGLIQVKLLFDPSPSSIAELHQSFPDAVRAESLAAFSSDQIDLAIIASPVQFHAQQTIHCLKSGLSVLCEKPMADTVAAAEAMIAAAARSRGILAIGLFRRFFPAAQSIQKIISTGMLGDVQSFEWSEGDAFRWPVQSLNYFKRSLAGGGVLLDTGIHLLDLLVWWFGEPTKIQYEDDAMGGIEVNCRLHCEFPTFFGTVHLSRDCALPNQCVIRGSSGWLTWALNESDNLQIGFKDSQLALDAKVYEAETRLATLPKLTRAAFNFEQSFIHQICNVIAAMKDKSSLMVPASEGIRSLRWIEHCYQTRTLMPMPWLSVSEASRAQQLNRQSNQQSTILGS